MLLTENLDISSNALCDPLPVCHIAQHRSFLALRIGETEMVKDTRDTDRER